MDVIELELMEIILMIMLAALIVMAAAAAGLWHTGIKLMRLMERRVPIGEQDMKPATGYKPEKPPDGRRKPQTAADEYKAPMVMRAQRRLDRLEQEMRSGGHGG